jgi:hypothetical protein
MRDLGFTLADYFLPLNQNATTTMTSVIMEKPEDNLFVAINEGIDGWTVTSASRVIKFCDLLRCAFVERPTPYARIMTFYNNPYLYLVKPKTPLYFPLKETCFAESHISTSVRLYGEHMQHLALDASKLLAALSNTSREHAFYTIHDLFHDIQQNNLLPVESSSVFMAPAGKIKEEKHVLKQFFLRALCLGFFFEITERMGANARRGRFSDENVQGLYAALQHT